MSDFAVLVEPIRAVLEHPNADALEIAQIRGYQAIVLKDQYEAGDLVAYIPEQAVMPDDLIEEMGLTGRLAGKERNRVKAIRLRGVLSQGLCYPAREGWEQGQDVTEELGITKWDPPIPAHMGGELWNAGSRRCLKYDIQNWKNYPEVLQDDEEVVFTEKIHGTFCGFGLLPKVLHSDEHGSVTVFSKGLGGRGLAFQLTDEEGNQANEKNLYVRAYRKFEHALRLIKYGEFHDASEEPLFILGEVFGRGIQDLAYGANSSQDEQLGYRVFDAYAGFPGRGRYLNDAELEALCTIGGLPRVPVLYRGPFSKEVMEDFTDGRETLSGQNQHIREGIVMRPVLERRDPELGRVILKSVSGAYLTRKGKNVTEYN